MKKILLLVGVTFLAACSHSTSPGNSGYLGMWYQRGAPPQNTDTLNFIGPTQCTLTGGGGSLSPSVKVSRSDSNDLRDYRIPVGSILLDLSWPSGYFQGNPVYVHFNEYLNLTSDSLLPQWFDGGVVFTR